MKINHLKHYKRVVKAKKEYYVRLEQYNRDILTNFLATGDLTRDIIFTDIKDLNRKALTDYYANLLTKYDLDKTNPVLVNEAQQMIEQCLDNITDAETNRIIDNCYGLFDLINNYNVQREYLENLIKTSNDLSKDYTTIKEEIRTEATPDYIMDSYKRGGRTKYVYDPELGKTRPKQVTYKNLDGFARDIEKYNINTADYDRALLMNKESQLMGEGDVYIGKEWIWSQAENTRHSGMDGTIIPIHEKFVVINEVTGETDYGLYPCDFVNMGPGNTVNCLCSILFHETI